MPDELEPTVGGVATSGTGTTIATLLNGRYAGVCCVGQYLKAVLACVRQGPRLRGRTGATLGPPGQHVFGQHVPLRGHNKK